MVRLWSGTVRYGRIVIRYSQVWSGGDQVWSDCDQVQSGMVRSGQVEVRCGQVWSDCGIDVDKDDDQEVEHGADDPQHGQDPLLDVVHRILRPGAVVTVGTDMAAAGDHGYHQ